jgi:hypothetical protein
VLHERSADELFAEDDFGWLEPVAGGAAVQAVPAPASLPPPRRARTRTPPRTLGRDLARLRAGIAERPSGLALVLALLVALILATVVARSGLWGGGEKAARTNAPPKAAAEADGRETGVTAQPALRRAVGPGAEGRTVRGLQAGLLALGASSQAPDGGYSGATAAAVSSFQAAHGLAADGVAGEDTAAALREALVDEAAADGADAKHALAAAAARGRLPRAAAKEHGRSVDRAIAAIGRLPADRGGYVALVLHQVAGHGEAYDAPRTLALFGMLDANVAELARQAPGPKRDIRDADGVTYRFFPARGFEFHPLASFSRLNIDLAAGRQAAAARLARALVARGIREHGALEWEYSFSFGGPDRWVSGLAQAVAAQSLARVGAAAHDRGLSDAAAAAYRAIPAMLSRPLAGGTWVREYGFSDAAILNAQLQTIVSLTEYANTTGDARARALVASMTTAARTLLPTLDTGCWSLYQVNGQPASVAYHSYHVLLLRQLAHLTGESIWSQTAARWAGYLRASGGTGPRIC